MSDTWKLSPADSQRFVEVILGDCEPNDALRAAAERYRNHPSRNQLVVLEGSTEAEFDSLGANELQIAVQVADRIMERVQSNAPVSMRRILHEELASLLLRIKRDAGWQTWPGAKPQLDATSRLPG